MVSIDPSGKLAMVDLLIWSYLFGGFGVQRHISPEMVQIYNSIV